MIERKLSHLLPEYEENRKALLIKGARQVGKTTLVQAYVADKESVLWIDGDDPMIINTFDGISRDNLLRIIRGYTYVIIDEAQRIPNVGLISKMILDSKEEVQLILSGSSTLDLNTRLNEPLTGRKWTFELFPLSWAEIENDIGYMEASHRLDEFLIYGCYPEIFLGGKKEKRLQELTTSYLYKDILELADVRKPEVFNKLLQALAYQVGNEVSYNELGNMLNLDTATVERYIGLLEESYVVYRLKPLATNPRKEISTSRKIYFYDNGIRNAIIRNFNTLNNRNDIGALWENYLMSEFRKKEAVSETSSQFFFWRSKGQSEVDLVVKNNDRFRAYEFKYNKNRKARIAPSFMDRYSPEQVHIVNRENFTDFF